jgi:uncharacterized protein YraI
MKHLKTILIALALLVPALAEAQLAYATKDVHMRAGPRRDYPVVAILPANAQVTVQGCLADYSWCDVIAPAVRGWVWAGNLAYLYQNAPVPLIEYGPRIGIVVVPFLLAAYWDRFYRDRPWYRDRDRWVHAPRPPRAVSPARPAPRAAPAPRHAPPRSAQPAPKPRAPQHPKPRP